MSTKELRFKTKMISLKPPKDERIKKLVRWCRVFHKNNFAPPYKGGSHGNLSFRLSKGSNKFIITGSHVGLKDELTNDSFVEVVSCDLQKRIVYAHGIKKPSSESMLHFAIYKKRKDVGAVFHGHSKKVLSSAAKLRLPVTLKMAPYGTVELVKNVLNILDKKTFFVMKNHGFVSVGKTMDNAGKLALKVCKKCK